MAQVITTGIEELSAFLRPYHDGSRDEARYQVVFRFGKSKGKYHTWAYDPLPLHGRPLAAIAAQVLRMIASERRLTRQRGWICIFERGASNPAEDMEIELEAREPDDPDEDVGAAEGNKSLSKALEEGNITKLVGHMLYSQQGVIDSMGTRWDAAALRYEARINHLEGMVTDRQNRIETVVAEREDLRAKLTISEARTGVMLASAVKDVAPGFFKAVEAWGGRAPGASSAGQAAGDQAGAGKGATGKATDKTAVTREKPVEQMPDGEVLDALLVGVGELLQKDPSLITLARYRWLADTMDQINRYATMMGYSRT